MMFILQGKIKNYLICLAIRKCLKEFKNNLIVLELADLD